MRTFASCASALYEFVTKRWHGPHAELGQRAETFCELGAQASAFTTSPSGGVRR